LQLYLLRSTARLSTRLLVNIRLSRDQTSDRPIAQHDRPMAQIRQ